MRLKVQREKSISGGGLEDNWISIKHEVTTVHAGMPSLINHFISFLLVSGYSSVRDEHLLPADLH